MGHRRRKNDIFLLFGCLFLFTILYWVTTWQQPPSINQVTIEQAGRIVYHREDVQDAEIVEINGPLGVSVVNIAATGAAMLQAPCPDQCCVHQGMIRRGVIVCVPQRIIVHVSGPTSDEGYDAVLH